MAVALGKSLLPLVKVAFVNYEDLMGVIASIEDLFLESSILCFEVLCFGDIFRETF